MSKIYGIGDEEELVEDLQKELFELKRNPNIIEIPNNATNGEVIKALFPNAENIRVDGGYPLNYIIEGEWHRNLKEWWNAPYNLPETKGELNGRA